MSTAAITIEQNGVRGAASTSRDDIVVGQPVTLRNFNDSGVTAWRWKLTLPKGSSAALSNVVAAAPVFTPDVPGTYVIDLAVDQGDSGQVDRRVVTVRLPTVATVYGPITPRFLGVGEGDEANWQADFGGALGVRTNDTGWWEDLDRWLRILADLAAGGGGGDWASVLAAGNVSGANDAVMDGEQRFISGQLVGPGPAGGLGWRTARRFNGPFVAGGFTNMGNAINPVPLTALNNQRVLVRAYCSTAQGLGSGAFTGWSILEEVWAFNLAGAGTRTRTVLTEGAGFQFVAPGGGDLFLQVNDAAVGSGNAYAMIDVVIQPGTPP